MSIEEKCYNAIGNYTTIDYLYNLCKPHKNSTVDRKLRILTHSGKIVPLFEKNAIVAYQSVEPINYHIDPKNAPQTPLNALKQANERIREILRALKPDFSTYHQVLELGGALKLKYLSSKLAIIKRYEQQRNKI
jgi:hypothetical protein